MEIEETEKIVRSDRFAFHMGHYAMEMKNASGEDMAVRHGRAYRTYRPLVEQACLRPATLK